MNQIFQHFFFAIYSNFLTHAFPKLEIISEFQVLLFLGAR